MVPVWVPVISGDLVLSMKDLHLPRGLLPLLPSSQDHRVCLKQNRNQALDRNELSNKSSQNFQTTGKKCDGFSPLDKWNPSKGKCIFIYN